MDGDESEYGQLPMLGSAPAHMGSGAGRPYLSTSLPTGTHLYSSAYTAADHEDEAPPPHVPLPKKLYPPPPHPSQQSPNATTTTTPLATSSSTPAQSVATSTSSSSGAATHFPSTSSSFYSGPNLGRLSPRFSLPSSYGVGAYPSSLHAAGSSQLPQFSSLLSVISNKAPNFVDLQQQQQHHGGSGSGSGQHRPTTTTAGTNREREREGKVEAKEAKEREKLDKKERKKWNKLKNRTLGDSTSPTNSITSITALAGGSGGASKEGRRPDKAPLSDRSEAISDAAIIARRTTAAAIAAAAASVANGMPGADGLGTGYSYTPAHMEEAGGVSHSTHRYHTSRIALLHHPV
jgi:hypothetical protein